MDLVPSISYLMPPLVIAELFGIPPEDRERFQQWAVPLAQFSSPTVGMDMVTVARQANEAVLEFNQYLGAAIEERRRRPGDDVLSRMIHVQREGGMTQEELVANALLILTAGHITTTDQISNGVHDLLTHPDELRKLQRNPELVKSAVEEMLRFSPSVSFAVRIATESFQLRGRDIREGDVVFLGMAAANRDPAVFPDPDRFDITRDTTHQKHQSFGFGAHHCLGAGLARRELEIALLVLLENLPGLRLDETRLPRFKCNSLLFRGFESLHVRW
jgi:cytochrome P450 PksS